MKGSFKVINYDDGKERRYLSRAQAEKNALRHQRKNSNILIIKEVK